MKKVVGLAVMAVLLAMGGAVAGEGKKAKAEKLVGTFVADGFKTADKTVKLKAGEGLADEMKAILEKKEANTGEFEVMGKEEGGEFVVSSIKPKAAGKAPKAPKAGKGGGGGEPKQE